MAASMPAVPGPAMAIVLSFSGRQGRGGAKGLDFPSPHLAQVFPVWVQGRYQRNLLAPDPSFDLFLTLNRHPHIRRRFVVDKSRQLVSLREAAASVMDVLMEAPLQVIRDAGVQRARVVRHDVHVVIAHRVNRDSSLRSE